MDFVERFSNSWTGQPGRQLNLNTFLKFHDLSPHVQAHLQQVYVTLTVAVAISACGVAFNIWTGVGGFLSILGFLVCVPWLMSTPATRDTLSKRQALLGAAAFCQGLVLGPLVNTALHLHPGTLLTALLGTCLVFACFSGAALLSRRRSYLFLGGLLSSVLSTLALMRVATWFLGGGALLFEAELYLGLLVFCGYVLFDTQMIVERAEAQGSAADPVRHALDLFVDFAAIFARVLVVLLRNAERREGEGTQRGERSKRRR